MIANWHLCNFALCMRISNNFYLKETNVLIFTLYLQNSHHVQYWNNDKANAWISWSFSHPTFHHIQHAPENENHNKIFSYWIEKTVNPWILGGKNCSNFCIMVTSAVYQAYSVVPQVDPLKSDLSSVNLINENYTNQQRIK